MNTREFVKTVRKSAGRRPLECPPLFVACGEGAVGPWVWTRPASAVRDSPRPSWCLTKSVYVALVHPDGSAQLLSRDEDECLLFAALWELER